MTLPFVDQTERDYQKEREADEQRQRLRLVHAEVAGGREHAEEEIVRLAVDFAEGTDSANFILAHYAETSDKFPGVSDGVRELLDAIIGGTGGSPEWVPLTDEDLAARMGCTTKTVQNRRNALRAWPDYTKLVDIKDNYQNPETLKSYPHMYRCHVPRLAAETTLEARLSPGYDDAERRGAVFAAAGRVTAQAARGYAARPPKRKRRPTEGELLLGDLEQAVRRIKSATDRQSSARFVDPDRIEALRAQLTAAVAEFDDAFGFAETAPAAPAASTQVIKDIRTYAD